MKKTLKAKLNTTFAQAISLLLIFSVLSFGYQPSCKSMDRFKFTLQSESTEVLQTTNEMLADHSCCVKPSVSKINSGQNPQTKLEVSKFSCSCKSQVLNQFSQNENLKSVVGNITWNLPELKKMKSSLFRKEIFISVQLSTGPPSVGSLYNTLQQILI